MDQFKLNTIEEALEEFRAGNFVIVVDDEDRENEGDFIIAAEKNNSGKGKLYDALRTWRAVCSYQRRESCGVGVEYAG